MNYQHWAAIARSRTRCRRTIASGSTATGGCATTWKPRADCRSQRNQGVRPGDIVVTSELAYPLEFTTGGGKLAPLAQQEIRPWLPLRLFGLHSRSGYSNVDKGFLPFDISTAPIDRVRAEQVVKREPTREDLPMNAPEAQEQIVSGVYPLEGGNTWRWTGGRAVILLKKPAAPERLRVSHLRSTTPRRRARSRCCSTACRWPSRPTRRRAVTCWNRSR